MSISIPDDRELKIDVSLSAIYMPEVGQANGYYSVFNFAPDPQNLRSLNYDNKNNNPKIVFDYAGNLGTPLTQYADFKLGSRVKFVPSLQNAHVLEPITHPTASSCTFAFGGIISDTFHPIFTMLKGPTNADYTQFPQYSPVRASTVSNLTTLNFNYDFSDLDNFKPLIPFIREYSFSSGDNNFSPIPPYTNTIRFSHWVMFNNLNSNGPYATYNIWNLVDSNEAPKSTSVREYEGPVGSTVSGKSNASIKTIRDGINGARLFVDSKGKGKSCVVKRIFPTSKDVIFNSPFIFFPSKIRNALQSNIGYLVLNGEKITSVSGANNGFHIQLSNLNASASDSNISIIYEDKAPKDNTIYSVTINLTPNSLPQIITKYKKNNVDLYYQYSQIKAPLFDGKATLGYDIFLHFVGPVMLIGFTSDQSNWNAIYPEEIPSTTDVSPNQPIQDKANIEHYFGKDTSYIKILSTNASYEMRYSAILFNNYAKPSTVVDNNYELRNFISPTILSSYVASFAGVELLNTKNQILMTFTAPQDKKSLIAASNIENTFHLAKYFGVNGFRYNSLPDKTISAMPDWRSFIPADLAKNPTDFVFKQIATSVDANPPFITKQYSQSWGNLFFNGTIEGPAFLSLESPAQNTFKTLDFLYPIIKGNLTPWVNNIAVSCSTDLQNFSLIRKTSTISLTNLDTTPEGLRLLELMEKNILVVTVKAGYGKIGADSTYFQGVITQLTTSRTGSKSNITLECQDLGNYILDNLYFDYIVPFGNRSIKTCIQAVINFSGFSKYYTTQNENLIGGLNLRIVNNPAANQDAIRATNLDKIGDKLQVFLTKLMTLEQLPTFRWLEDSGFVLDARYADANIDQDLKFVGYDVDTNQTYNLRTTGLNSNNVNISIPDWHGLLSGDFNVSTRLSPLSYQVSTYGFTYEGLIEQHTDQKFHDLKMSTNSLNSVVNAVVSTNPAIPASYVGFRKKVIDSLERNELPTSELVKLKHKQNEFITTIPIHDIQFNCYVTKPLKFHGVFRINAIAGSDNTVTSKYIYQSVNYTIDKSQNLITASVTGFSHPWTVKDLQIGGE